MSRTKDEKTQNTFKIVLAGDTAVGKTWINNQLFGKHFDNFTLSTIGASFGIHKIKLQDETSVKLEIWDTAGQSRYLSLLNMYFRRAHGIIMVYDITDKETFDAMKVINNILISMRDEVFHITL